MFNENGGKELTSIHFLFLSHVLQSMNSHESNSLYRTQQRFGVGRRRQAAFNAALGVLHVFECDILRLLGHVRFMLRDVGAVAD